MVTAMNICLFTPEEIAKPLDIRDARAEHILKILHKKVGDSFTAGVIGGMAGHATITGIDIREESSPDGRKHFDAGSIHFSFTEESDGKPLFPLCMIIGFPRPIQLKRLLRDMAGLGVAEIHLTGTELGDKSYLKSNLATSDAGYQMLLEGTQQAGGTHVPRLFRHNTLAECLAAVDGDCRRLALDNVRPETSLHAFLLQHPEAKMPRTVAAIGSERGWTDSERQLLSHSGYTLLGMGSRILRTETAATVAASLILAAGGALS
jgi:RsmE family RNA methyltransferase